MFRRKEGKMGRIGRPYTSAGSRLKAVPQGLTNRPFPEVWRCGNHLCIGPECSVFMDSKTGLQYIIATPHANFPASTVEG